MKIKLRIVIAVCIAILVVASAVIGNYFSQKASLRKIAAADTTTLFDELKTSGTSGRRIDMLVSELSRRPFSQVGTQAVQIICNYEGGWYNASTKKPWLEHRCPERARKVHAAWAIWRSAIVDPESSMCDALTSLILEARPEKERLMYLQALLGNYSCSQAKVTLQSIATDTSQPPVLSVKAAEALMMKEDANQHLITFVEACNRVPDVSSRSELFRNGVEKIRVKLNHRNLKISMNEGFLMLGLLDDSKSGRGYFFGIVSRQVFRRRKDIKRLPDCFCPRSETSAIQREAQPH